MSKRLLVVDDSAFILNEMKFMLKDSEYEIAAYAKSGEEALALFPKLKPDVVTMDIILPGIDGLDTSRLILQQWPLAKIIIVSSLAYDETINQAKDVGACGFLFKPFEEEKLKCALERAVR